MEYRRFGNTIIARIDRGEEVLEQVKAIAQAEQIKLASVQALGAVGSCRADRAASSRLRCSPWTATRSAGATWVRTSI